MKFRTVLRSFLGLALSLAFGASLDANAHSGNIVDGRFTVLVGDAAPQIGGPPRVYYNLIADDGHVLPLDLTSVEIPVGGIRSLNNKRVRVTATPGVQAQNLPFAMRFPTTSIQVVTDPNASAADAAQDLFPTIGTRKYKTLLCKWPDVSTIPPVTASTYFQNQLGSTYPGFDHYFQETSYGLATIAGSSAATSWATVSHARSTYNVAANDGSYLTAMAQDCINSYDGTVDFSQFVGINLMFNGKVDECCAWGGGALVTVDGVQRVMSMTWMPYNFPTWGNFGWHEHGVLAHELSHSFGSPHSNDPSGYQYGNWWDVVSKPGGTCNVTDALYGCIGQHAVGDNKLTMLFIPGARIATHAVGAAATSYQLERAAQPPNAGGTKQILKILTPNAHKYYTVESRLRIGYDANIPGDGVLIHEVIDNRPFISGNNPGDPARLLTPSGSTAAGTGDIQAMWHPGDVYVNITDDIKIIVGAYSGQGTSEITVQPSGPGTLAMKSVTRSVSEAAGVVNVLVARMNGSLGAVSVDYATANGTALDGTDYSGTNGTFTWADGDSTDRTIPVPITQNAISDGSRTFTVTLSNPTGGAAATPVLTTVTINDDEQSFNFSQPTTSYTEGGAASVSIAVARTGSSAGAVSVQWATSNGTAVAGTDFGVSGSGTQKSGTLSWVDGDGGVKNITLGLATSNIPVLTNTIVDGARTFTIGLSNPTGVATIGAANTNTVTINDNDSAFAFSAPGVTVSEAGPNVTVTVTRTGLTTAVQAVSFATTAGTATATSDYTTTTGTLSFGVGETSKVITIGPSVVAAPFIRIMNDALIEGPETFTIALSAPTNGASLGAPASTTVTILSDEKGVSMAAATQPFTEGAGAQAILVNRSGDATTDLDVSYTFANGTAQNGLHFNGVNGSLHWNIGDGTPKSIPVTINDDGAPNTARTFTVTLSSATNATTIATPTTTATIADNDNTVQFTVASATVTEGTANLVLTVSRTGVNAGSASVTWTAIDGTAHLGTDFGGPGTGTLTWAAGSSVSQPINIPIVNDVLPNGARTFSVALSSPTGPNLSIGTNSNVAVILNDNEKVLQFEFATYSVTEVANPNVTIRLQRSGPATTTATATWATVNGSAESGKDFGLKNNFTPRTGSVSWAVGDMAAKTITIPILVDLLGGEGDETFTVVLTPGAGYLAGPNAVATVTIHDNDILPESNVQFSQPKYVVTEDSLIANLTVTRVDIGGGLSRAVSATYGTVPGTALATSDYITKTGTVSWGSGEGGSKPISIVIVNNTTPEPPESFKVTLSNLTPGLGLGTPNEATVLILDDDEVFPLDGAMPAGFTTPIGATKGWHVSNDPGAYDGVFSLKSDEIDDNETAALQLAGTFTAAGSVRFYVKVSTEPTFDTLQFFIDGVLQATWSGTASTAWQISASYPVSAVHHTLSWVYTKDGSASVGMDAVYLDGLTMPAFVPDP